MAKPHDPREEAEKAKKKPGGQQHQNPPWKNNTDNPELDVIGYRKRIESMTAPGPSHQTALVRSLNDIDIASILG